jgi:ATP-binding cassette subfamily F protein 3
MAIEKDVPNHGETLLRFEEVTFGYNENKLLLKEADFLVRRGAKLTLMGQNGAGKSTIFKMILGELVPLEGRIIKDKNLTVAIGEQFIPQEKWEMKGTEFLASAFKEKVYDIEPRAKKILDKLNFQIDINKQIKDLSGGQKARLLIAKAFITGADIIMLDEPTNNLDKESVKKLTDFMKDYDGTVIVISHDENFLNSFTHGIIYVNSQFQKIEQYVGNYFKALEEIKRKVEIEAKATAQREKKIQENKDKVNFFAHKGGKMRALAAKLKEEYEEMEEERTDERKDDRAIKNFEIKCQPDIGGNLIEIKEVELMQGDERKIFPLDVKLRKGDKIQIMGPNGIGKTTLFERLTNKTAKGTKTADDLVIGYYRQDFGNLDFNKTAYEELSKIFKRLDDHHVRSTAAKFLIGGKELSTKIGHLSEGQKALVMWAYLTLLEPGVLIIDEPTNHINFRHIPAIAEALKNFQGGMIIVSHVNNFIRQVGVTETIDFYKVLDAKK